MPPGDEVISAGSLVSWCISTMCVRLRSSCSIASAFDRLNGRAVDTFDEQRQPAPEDLEPLHQLFVIDVAAAQGIAIKRREQPLQLELGARRQPQADIHIAQLQLVLLLNPMEAEQQAAGKDQHSERKQPVPPRARPPEAPYRTCRAFSCQTDFSLVAKSSNSGCPDQG